MSGLDETEIQLEMRDRLNYPSILEISIRNIKTTVRNASSLTKVNVMILDFFYDIPVSWYDQDFAEDVRGVIKTHKVSNVQKFGEITLSKEYMKRHKIPLTKTVKEVDYFTLKNAIINLLDRRNMLVRKDKIEASTGVNLKFETLDDLIDEMGEDE